MKRITIFAAIAAPVLALALGLGITAANAASQPVERTLPTGAQAAKVVPMAIPSGSCIKSQSATMTTLFVRPGVAVTRAQMADHLGVAASTVVDSSWPKTPTARDSTRVSRSGDSWTGSAGRWTVIGSTARTGVSSFHVVAVEWTDALPC